MQPRRRTTNCLFVGLGFAWFGLLWFGGLNVVRNGRDCLCGVVANATSVKKASCVPSNGSFSTLNRYNWGI